MKITVFPAGTFSGKVFLKDQKGKSGCEFSFVSGTSGPQEIDVKDADCGGVTKDEVCIIINIFLFLLLLKYL